MKKPVWLAFAAAFAAASAAVPPPAETAARVARQFLSADPLRYRPEGFGGAGEFAEKGYGDDFNVHYSVVSLWVNAIECARKSCDFALMDDLVRHFDSFYGERRQAQCTFRHVDYNVFGALPAEIFLQNGDRRAYDMAVDFAERQWERPGPRDPQPWYDVRDFAERLAWWEKGYSAQTRLWIDDMYMITFLQTQAYRITGERKCLERAAKEMALYLGEIQLENGLFHHSPEGPFAWARGNGWMAAGMTLLLEHLPKNDPHHAAVKDGYLLMMKTLLAHRRANGLWGQIVDDAESWDETSGSAMFAYAFQSGVNHGLLPEEPYGAAAKRAYAALVARLDEHANIADVCEGTGPKNDRAWYLGRGRVNGDPHGQAPLLWLCNALLDASLRAPVEESGKIVYRTDVRTTNCWLRVRAPKGVKGFPTVVWFHGGGLTGGAPKFRDFGDDGLGQVSVRYRFLSETDADGCIDDAAAAIAWTLKNIAAYGGDPKKVFVAGHSAGGYLTLMAGLDAARLARHGFKPTDLAGLVPVSAQATTHFAVRRAAGDADPRFLPKIDRLAPLAWCAAPSAPILFVVGDRAREWPCRTQENELMATSLRALGRADVSFREMPCRDHGGVLGASLPLVRDFVRRHSPGPFACGARPVARIRPRPAREVGASNWTIGCEVLDRELAIFSEYKDWLPKLGIKRIRLQGGWARCEKEKGVYDFAWLDEPVEFCRTNGMSVLMETSYGNPVYGGAGGIDLGAGFPTSEEGLAAWDRWVEALAKHFKGRVRDWAMWNEPDLKGRGFVSKTPERIAAFNVRTAKIIKRVIPDARIAALSLAHNDPKLLEACLRGMAGNLDLFDSIIYHGYSANPDDSYAKVEAQKKVAAKFAPHLRLEQGENGAPSSYCTSYALKRIPWNELSQAKWDVRRMLGDLGHDVASSVFTIMEYANAGRPLNTKGLIRKTGDRRFGGVKPAFWAVRNVAAVFDASVVRVKDSRARLLGGGRTAVFAYAAPGGRLFTYWDAGGRPDETLHPRAGALAVDGPPLKAPVLADPLTGDVFAVDPAREETADGRTLYRDLPVHDYPWILAEKSALPLAPARF